MWALFQAHNVPETFKVEKADGITQLLESIPVRLKASNLERFAVLLDADEDIHHRWEELRGRLVNAGCADIPAIPTSLGTIVQIQDGPKVGAWIMPDNHLPGMLETFLSFLVPTEDNLLPRVDVFLAGIPAEVRRCPPNRYPKARIHSWLALQEEPGKPLGQAITAKYLDAQSQMVRPFLDWIRKMFIE